MNDGCEFVGGEIFSPAGEVLETEPMILDRAIVRERVEEKGETKQSLFRVFLDEIPAPVLVIERETKTILGANAAARLQYGIESPPAGASSLFDWLLPENETSSEPFDPLKAKRLRTIEGEVRDVSPLVCDSLDASPSQQWVYLEDQTERKTAERSLRKIKRRLANLLDSMRDGYLSLDRGGTLTFANRTAQRFLGQGHAGLIGQTLPSLLADKAAPEFVQACEAAISRQAAFELTCSLADQKASWVLRGFPSQDGFSLYLNDQSEQVQLKERLLEKDKALKITLDGTIHALSYAMGLRDPYTAGHQRRVAKLVSAMASVRGCTPQEVERYRKAALLHDIGKISVPAEILSKPGQLSPAEMSLIQAHPLTGYEMLKGIEFEPVIAQVAYQHHERLDGSGYPCGLKGNEIIPEARMLAVADVVEAMASHRPFRPSLGIEAALNEVMQKRELLYDSEAVEACLVVLTQFGFDLEQFMEHEPPIQMPNPAV